MSRYIDIETIKPRQYENSEVELGALAYDYDEVNAMPFFDIVMCEECKYKRQCHKAVEHTTREMTSITIAYRPIEFCSRGEREDE